MIRGRELYVYELQQDGEVALRIGGIIEGRGNMQVIKGDIEVIKGGDMRVVAYYYDAWKVKRRHLYGIEAIVDGEGDNKTLTLNLVVASLSEVGEEDLARYVTDYIGRIYKKGVENIKEIELTEKIYIILSDNSVQMDREVYIHPKTIYKGTRR